MARMARIAALASFAGIRLAAADTPVHCLLEQMYGEWTVHMSAALEGDYSRGPPDCSAASATEGSYATMRLLAPNRIAWEGPDTPTDDRLGTFTMVYDEGWEATFPALGTPARGQPGVKLWGFLDWAQKNATAVVSHCGAVSAGSFHSLPRAPAASPTSWGCYRATKNRPPAPREHAAPSRPGWATADGGASGVYTAGPAGPLRRELPSAVVDNRPDAVKYAGLPEAVDWDLAGKVEMMRDQLTCGSCYAFAATSMLASRGRIGGADALYLSPQDVISCGSAKATPGTSTSYGQGCDGGFGYLVSKWAQDFTLASNECFPYESGLSDSAGPACSKRCTDAGMMYRATNIRYIGAYFGNCSEVGMMVELAAGGPIAVGITVPAR
jgi:cathepsin C